MRGAGLTGGGAPAPTCEGTCPGAGNGEWQPRFPFARNFAPEEWLNPQPPPALMGPIPPDGTLSALDAVSVDLCAGVSGRKVKMLTAVPPLLREQWALACTRMLRGLRQAHQRADEVEVTRHLKGVLILPLLLLREARQQRQEERRAAELARRFTLYQMGEYQNLLNEYIRDCARARGRGPGGGGPRQARGACAVDPPADDDGDGDDEWLVQRVEELMARGRVSDAARLLESFGVADITDPLVLQQMADKHPGRAPDAVMPPPPPDAPVLRVSHETLQVVCRRLDDTKAPGHTAWTNHILRVLAPTVPFQTPLANEVLPELAHFGELLLNGALPPWAYTYFAATRLVALNKHEQRLEASPDARPVGIGCCLRRTLTRAAFVPEEVQGDLREYLFPVQLAVSVPNGASLLSFSVRELMDTNKHFCVFTIDFKNAFNVIRRASCMQAVTAAGPLARFSRMLFAFLMPKSPIYSGAQDGLRLLPFDSEEGVQQGSVEGAPFFAVALQPLLLPVNAALAETGGAALAGADDVNLVGPPAQVFTLAEAFMAAVRAELGVDANLLKCFCWTAPENAPAMDACRGRFPWGEVTDAAGEVHRGITVYGVPMGSVGYVKAVLEEKCVRIAAVANTMITKLGRTHKQLLWLLTAFSTSHKLDYWLRHCPPGDIAEAAKMFDDTIQNLAAVALGCDPYSDEVAAERMSLPGRLGGTGLRSAVAVSGPAYLAGAVSAVSAFLDRFETVDGALVLAQPGVLVRPGIVARVGQGAFDDMEAGAAPGWQRFIAESGSTLGAEMGRIWGQAQREAEELGEGLVDEAAGRLRVLHLRQRDIWPQTEAGLQADICADLEGRRYKRLLRRLAAGHDCRMGTLVRNATRESTAWTRALPSEGGMVPVEEWAELTAHSLGLPSPIFAPLVGTPCGPSGLGLGRGRGGRGGGRGGGGRGGAQLTVDRYGDLPCAATGQTGDHYSRLRHDPLCDALADIMRMAGVPAKREDVAAFSQVPMAHARLLQALYGQEGGPHRRYPTPDITADLPRAGGRAGDPRTDVPTIVEVKTVVYCQSWYRPLDVKARAAVDRRAAAVPGERRRDLHGLDRELFDVAEGTRGPFEARLDAYPGGVVGVAVGAFGEWSASLVSLVEALAERGAERWMGLLAAPSLQQAEATLRQIWRQRLGMCALRGHARLMLARAHHLYLCQGLHGGPGGPRAAAGAPVGTGPEVGESVFAHAADGAYERCVTGLGMRGQRGPARCARAVAPGRAYHVQRARAPRARG